jgi:DNA-binding response OmpR family regulator
MSGSIDQDDGLEDIRPALKARLQRAVANRDHHAGKTAEFSAEVDDLTRQLDREEARFASKPQRLRLERGEPLTLFLLKEMAGGPLNKDKLRERANDRGYAVDGRSIHAALMNLERQGKVEELDDGRFGLLIASKEAAVSNLRRI